MWSLADEMENWIKGLLSAAQEGVVELRRSELASRFSCVPSQVTYVLATRFVPERGYRVESRRGAGGYIRIVRLPRAVCREHLAARVGTRVSQREALTVIADLCEAGLIDEDSAQYLALVLSDEALGLPAGLAGEVRARMLLTLLASV
ncbi:MAG TPA: CtsR family transcriptional regulator [Firmicutes bacterium]|nr:CtsR family transcriptional regulator [Bacillota bacterium]